MFKLVTTCCLLLSSNLPGYALDTVGELTISPGKGAGTDWQGELPPRFLASFEFTGASDQAQAIVKYDGDDLTRIAAEDAWKSVQIAVDTIAGVRSVWVGGKPILEEEAFRPSSGESTSDAPAGELWRSAPGEAGKEFDLGGEFTAAIRFRSDDGGTLLSKCAPEGKWTPDSKALFIKGGRLVYDIGWMGAIRTKKNIEDGEWHHAVLVYRSGRAQIFVDGKLEAERSGFTAPDPGSAVMKIGSAADDFGGSYGGDIGFVRFWKRALPETEIAALGRGDEAETNTPLLNWLGAGSEEEKAPTRDAAPTLRFQAEGGQLKFRNVGVEPLAEVDHARLIRGWDHLSLERGARIYNGLCITCHGDQKIEGTLPTALRFHSGEFKNGKDPLSMYNTLTNGFNLMVAQPWMTPTQKYDVIHYIRESFLKETNPKEFVEVDDTYLDRLPRGVGIGPTETTMFGDNDAPKYKKMNFGPVLFWTLEAGEGNIAYKGIAVRLDEGPGGISKGNKWLLYDHDTMRVAAAWTGDEFVNWRGIAFDQSHGSHTSIVGDIAFTNPVGPGWGRPGDGSFEEVRFRGRDDKPYGPLPRDWAHYEGLYLHGNRAVLHYTVGDAVVHELPGYEMHAGETIFTRTLNIEKSSDDLVLRIAPDTMAVTRRGGGELAVDDAGFHVLKIAAAATPVSVKILTAAIDDQDILDEYSETSGEPIELASLIAGGEKRWPGIIQTDGKMGSGEGRVCGGRDRAPVGRTQPVEQLDAPRRFRLFRRWEARSRRDVARRCLDRRRAGRRIREAQLAADRDRAVPAPRGQGRRRARSMSAAAIRSPNCTISTATARSTTCETSTTTTR